MVERDILNSSIIFAMFNIQRNEEFPAGSAACCSASLATSFTAAGDDHTSLKKKLLGCGKVCHEEPIFRWAEMSLRGKTTACARCAARCTDHRTGGPTGGYTTGCTAGCLTCV